MSKITNGILSEAIRLYNVECTLAKIGNGVMHGKGMPATWKTSVLIALYKGKKRGIETHQLQNPENVQTFNENCGKSF